MTYGFLGCGSMGGAIAARLSQSTKEITVSDRSGKAKRLAAELGIHYGDNIGIATNCDGIFLAVAVVDDTDAAIAHIARHSTGHSEAILTGTQEHADRFTALVDAAAVYVNASTRFTDGGEFGLGCEMGISTQKLHARGPMGLEELTTYKYVVRGSGQTR